MNDDFQPSTPTSSPRTGLVLVVFAHGSGVVLYEDLHDHVESFIREGGFALDVPFGLDAVNIDYTPEPDGVFVGEVVLADDGPGDYPGTRETRAEVRGLRFVTEEEWRRFCDDLCPFGECHELSATEMSEVATSDFDYLARLKGAMRVRLDDEFVTAPELVQLGDLAEKIDEVERARAREATVRESMKVGAVSLAQVVGPVFAKWAERSAVSDVAALVKEANVAIRVLGRDMAFTDASDSTYIEQCIVSLIAGVEPPRPRGDAIDALCRLRLALREREKVAKEPT